MDHTETAEEIMGPHTFSLIGFVPLKIKGACIDCLDVHNLQGCSERKRKKVGSVMTTTMGAAVEI